MMPCGTHNRMPPYFQPRCTCSACYPGFYGAPQKLSCCNLGFPNVPAPSSAMTLSRSSFNRADKCFLRPYLTREEYIYWSRHSSHMLASCACPDCISPMDATTTVMYQHKKPPVSVRNVTGMPFRGRAKSGCPGFYSGGFEGCFCGQAWCGPVVPQTPSSSKVKGKVVANYPQCHSMDSVSKGNKGRYSYQQSAKAPPSNSSDSFVQPEKKMSNAKANTSRSVNLTSTGKGDAYQESTSKSLRRISEQYLCGDRSFDEIPTAQIWTTTGNETSNKTRFPVLCDSTYACSQLPRIESTSSFPVKRKSTDDSELGTYSQNKQKKQAGIHQVQSQYDTIELNDTWKKYLDCSLPLNGYESGRKTFIGDQPLGINQTDGITSTSVTSPVNLVGDHTPNDRGKSVEPFEELFKTVKPIPRRLLKDGGTSAVSGSYALDYDCLPKVVDVLPSNLATAISGSLKAIRS